MKISSFPMPARINGSVYFNIKGDTNHLNIYMEELKASAGFEKIIPVPDNPELHTIFYKKNTPARNIATIQYMLNLHPKLESDVCFLHPRHVGWVWLTRKIGFADLFLSNFVAILTSFFTGLFLMPDTGFRKIDSIILTLIHSLLMVILLAFVLASDNPLSLQAILSGILLAGMISAALSASTIKSATSFSIDFIKDFTNEFLYGIHAGAIFIITTMTAFIVQVTVGWNPYVVISFFAFCIIFFFFRAISYESRRDYSL